jgi:hypothetical protein
VPKATDVFSDEIQKKLEEYAPGWLDTLGELGAPPDNTGGKTKPSVAPNVRAQAAKVGLDLYSKMVGPGGAVPKGKALIEALAAARNGDQPDDDESDGLDNPDVGEGPDDVGAESRSGATHTDVSG